MKLTSLNRVKKLFLVAPPSLDCKIEELQSFFPLMTPSNLSAEETLLITSTNDPYLDTTEAKELQKALDVKMEVIQDGGHINADSNYGPWNWILQEVKKSF